VRIQQLCFPGVGRDCYFIYKFKKKKKKKKKRNALKKEILKYMPTNNSKSKKIEKPSPEM